MSMCYLHQLHFFIIEDMEFYFQFSVDVAKKVIKNHYLYQILSAVTSSPSFKKVRRCFHV